MKIIERKMDESSLLMSHICPKVFTTNSVPSTPKFSLDLSLYYASHLAVLLGLKDALDVGYFLDGRVSYTHDDALFFWSHVGVADEHFLGGSFLPVLFWVFLLFNIDFTH